MAVLFIQDPHSIIKPRRCHLLYCGYFPTHVTYIYISAASHPASLSSSAFKTVPILKTCSRRRALSLRPPTPCLRHQTTLSSKPSGRHFRPFEICSEKSFLVPLHLSSPLPRYSLVYAFQRTSPLLALKASARIPRTPRASSDARCLALSPPREILICWQTPITPRWHYCPPHPLHVTCLRDRCPSTIVLPRSPLLPRACLGSVVVCLIVIRSPRPPTCRRVAVTSALLSRVTGRRQMDVSRP